MRLTRMMMCCALAVAAAGCGDDAGTANNGGANNGPNNGANNGPANNGPANNGPANNGANNGPANNGTNNGPANNGNNGVERPPCETIEPAEQAEATYDAYLLPPLEEVVPNLSYVAATVIRDGDDVTVVVDEDEIQARFDTTAGFEHCVTNPEAAFIKLCFFTASGEPAAPGALGAVFRPFGNALFAVVAHRRDVVRPCTAAGHYQLDSREISDAVGDEAFVNQTADALLGYLGLFIIADTATVVFGEEPRQVVVEYSDAAGTFSGSFEDELTLMKDGPVYDLAISFEAGALTLEDDGAASVTTTATVVVSGGDLEAEVSFTAQLGGPRL